MKSSSRLLLVIFGVLVACICLALLAIIGLVAWTLNDPPVARSVIELPTPLYRATAAPASTETPAPTNTRVIQPGTSLPPLVSPVRTATRASSRNIVIPTPTASISSALVKYETKFTVTTYNVMGKTLNDISKSLNAQALPDPHEPFSRYYARTDWYLTGDWFWKPSASGCELTGAQVMVAVTMTLPALTTVDAPAEVQTQWNQFIDNTITHESVHVKLAYDGARNYQRELSQLAPTTNCDLLQNRLNEIFRKNFDQIDRANVDYDKRTKHGETQGAIFP